jgi:excinuclease ABC subunit A
MNFLPDVYVQCDVCKGERYNRETLQVKYKGKSLAEPLCKENRRCPKYDRRRRLRLLPKHPPCRHPPPNPARCRTRLRQTRTNRPTLSGGEAQRVKLATELSKRATGKTLYLIDEPTTGLSFYDVHKLLDVLQRRNSAIAIGQSPHSVNEHNLDVIRCSDWTILFTERLLLLALACRRHRQTLRYRQRSRPRRWE